MSINHTIDGTVVEIIVQGHITIDELLAGFGRVLEDGNIPSRANMMINVIDSQVIPSLETMEQIAAILASGQRQFASRLAVLVGNPVRFGRARQLGALLEFKGLVVRPFYDRREAMEWILSPSS